MLSSSCRARENATLSSVRLLEQSGNQKGYHQSGRPIVFNTLPNGEPSSALTNVVPPLPLPVINENNTETTPGKPRRFERSAKASFVVRFALEE